jgi:hypothetical protein
MLLPTLCAAQSERQPQAGGREGPSLEQRIQWRLNRLKQEQEAYERALQLLAEGASEARVREAMPEDDGRLGDEDERGSRDHDGRRDRRMSPELRAEVLGFIEANFPELWEKMAELSPEDRARMSDRFAPRFFEFERARKRDIRLGALKLDELRAGFKLLEAVGDYRSALHEGTSLSTVRGAMRQAIADRFDAQQASKQREVELLDERVGELERELAERAADREAIVSDKLERIESSIARDDHDDRRRRRRDDGG